MLHGFVARFACGSDSMHNGGDTRARRACGRVRGADAETACALVCGLSEVHVRTVYSVL